MPLTKQRKPVGAFTLIELLVVIAIIALLVAILVPSLSQARMLAQRVKCATNERSMGIGVNFYANENIDIVPPSFTWNAEPAGTTWVQPWANYIVRYVDANARGGKNGPYGSVMDQRADGNYYANFARNGSIASPVFDCPGIKNTGADCAQSAEYSWNASSAWAAEWNLAGVLTRVTIPLKIQRFSASRYCTVMDSPANFYLLNYPTRFQTFMDNFPHARSANGLFLDGHVEVFTRSRMLEIFARDPNTFDLPLKEPTVDPNGF